MSMEAEVLPLLKFGFGIVMILISLVVIALLVKYKRAGYGWIFVHLILFSWACWGWIELLEKGRSGVMASEDNSLDIGMIGVIWAVSMVCMSVGLIKLRPSHDRLN
ncbi:hypothetical protein [Paenibacillus sedimenti]|uniref:Uncharacterized protein n=1 Tax=Paenibacillus sedimenti TaxID=2770274 RepID=A0A926KV30_9BACL|nr:hypothetical protein [Paenibacillus sedimenti]MBD0384694.1 hypothetical protein [Paenibacillus sedimenti]